MVEGAEMRPRGSVLRPTTCSPSCCSTSRCRLPMWSPSRYLEPSSSTLPYACTFRRQPSAIWEGPPGVSKAGQAVSHRPDLLQESAVDADECTLLLQAMVGNKRPRQNVPISRYILCLKQTVGTPFLALDLNNRAVDSLHVSFAEYMQVRLLNGLCVVQEDADPDDGGCEGGALHALPLVHVGDDRLPNNNGSPQWRRNRDHNAGTRIQIALPPGPV